MAQITGLGVFRHLRAEPNQFILHYGGGKLVRKGAGLAYWFLPLSASVAQLPVEDIETTFVLTERSADYQEITVQVTLSFRFADPERAAKRINMTISSRTGVWVEQPLERLASMWSHWGQHAVRASLTTMPVMEAVTVGPERIRQSLEETLRGNPEIEAMGLSLVAIQVDQVAPTSEVEKALQTPTRESIQQKADEATFQRRALAVEKERAIKENELATEIELARRQGDLIRQQGANQLLDVRQQAEVQKMSVAAEAERREITAESTAKEARIRGEADADARQRLLTVENDSEARHVGMWKEVSPPVIFGLAMQQLAGKLETIHNLNITPDLLGGALQELLTGKRPAE
jgi:regulator of protease activity HflC (stomatin/prohibitin superfamily)